MNKLYQQKHQLWLHILFASFAIDDESIKSKLYDFSQMAFRHMKWLAHDILKNGDDYNYDRDMILYKRENVFDILEALKDEIKKTQELYGESALFSRIKSDEDYLINYIDQLLSDTNNNQPVYAFNMKNRWGELDVNSLMSLQMFLFEESYKEYELILVYAYMQARTKNLKEFDVFQDLVDESHFHLKSFGNMMAKLGILALPRELHEMTYKIKDLKKFIEDGIKEEEAAKEMCRELSDSINDEELSKFFNFIDAQENYHIELMQRLL
ncbi:MAG: iron-binding protein [Epsilonproteobacteria bacterium]|nr:iron-binding protein [Campylobacterota bacterium]